MTIQLSSAQHHQKWLSGSFIHWCYTIALQVPYLSLEGARSSATLQWHRMSLMPSGRWSLVQPSILITGCVTFCAPAVMASDKMQTLQVNRPNRGAALSIAFGNLCNSFLTAFQYCVPFLWYILVMWLKCRIPRAYRVHSPADQKQMLVQAWRASTAGRILPAL